MDSNSRVLPVVQAGQLSPAGAPLFERIGIVGLGLIGGSIALAARQLWPSGLVIGVDRKEVLERAVQRHAIDVAAAELTIISEADLVVLAAPVVQNLGLLAQLPDHLEKTAIVTDVGSTKRGIARAARALPERLVFVGGHPLAGGTRAGIENARSDLFAGRPWLFTPPATGEAINRQAGGDPLGRLFRFAEALGARPKAIDAAEHDRLVAFLSHLPQLTASALLGIVGDAVGDDGLALSGRGLLDTTRLAGSPVDIWRDICLANADEIRPAIDRLIDTLTRLRDGLDDAETIERVFDAANKWRLALEESFTTRR